MNIYLNSLIFFVEKNQTEEVFDDDSDDDELEGKTDRIVWPNCIAQAKGTGV